MKKEEKKKKKKKKELETRANVFYLHLQRTKCQEKYSWESTATRRGAINNGPPQHFFARILLTVLVGKKTTKKIIQTQYTKK